MRHIYFQNFLAVTCLFFCLSIFIEKDLLADNHETSDTVGQEIPLGFKSIPVEVKDPSEFEKSLKEGDRVDVLWKFLQDGVEKKPTIARFVEILSITYKTAAGGDGAREEQTLVANLSVSEEQNKNIEMARSQGTYEMVSVVPFGFKMISIEIKDPSGKESSVKSGYRVDVVSNQNQQDQDGGANKNTIARFMKVLSSTYRVNQDTEKGKFANLNVSLMVTEEQYRDINLAKESGARIGLGNISDPDPCGRWEASSMRDHIPNCTKQRGSYIASDNPIGGELHPNDPKTGKQQRYILNNGKWSIDKSYVDPE